MFLKRYYIVATARLDPEGSAIVMVGFWNRMIFTPSWMSGRITEKTEIECEVPVDNPNNPIRFKFDGVGLSIQARRLILSVDRCDAPLFEQAKDLAIKILEALPHTPVSAIGINFRFQIDNPETPLLKIFQTSDVNLLSDARATILGTTITRKMEFQGKQVNLGLTLNEAAKVQILFNFHRDTQGTAEALESLTSGIVPLKSAALSILNSVYNLTLEEIV